MTAPAIALSLEVLPPERFRRHLHLLRKDATPTDPYADLDEVYREETIERFNHTTRTGGSGNLALPAQVATTPTSPSASHHMSPFYGTPVPKAKR